MTLREAVRRADAQNPDVTLARLDEENARHGVQVAKDPFAPRIVVGSGLAYSNGFPMSIEGSAPSIVQARASQFIFNRQQSLPGGAGKGTGARRGHRRGQQTRRSGVSNRIVLPGCRTRGARRRTGTQRCGQPANRARIDSGAGEGRARAAAGREDRRRCNWRGRGRLAGVLDNDQATAETQLAIAVGYHGGRPGTPGGGAAAGGGTAGIGGASRAERARNQQGFAQTAIADRRQGTGEARRERGAPAARRPGGAVRTVREVQSLRGLLPQVPAQ